MHRDRMSRRATLALAGVGAAALAAGPRPALAQQQAQGELTDAQRRYAHETLEVGRFLLETSQAAMERASDEEVTDFARREAAEQEAMRAILTSLGAEVPELEPQHENGLAALRDGGEGGMSPDLVYVNAQILGHGSLLKLQQSMSKQEPITMTVATAKLAEEATKAHLAALEDMKIRLMEG